jgi:hypothetical protein
VNTFLANPFSMPALELEVPTAAEFHSPPEKVSVPK